jgi:hypothetical protein
MSLSRKGGWISSGTNAWEIPSGAKIEILQQLSKLGITHRTAFPDLDGIARSLWETQVLWTL